MYDLARTSAENYRRRQSGASRTVRENPYTVTFQAMQAGFCCFPDMFTTT